MAASSTLAPPLPFTLLPLLAATHEGLEAWASGCEAWARYLGGLAMATTPAGAAEAYAQFVADGFETCSRAAGRRLVAAGVRTPLLNDA